MKSKRVFIARMSRKRARTQARRLGVLIKQYRNDPVRNFCTHSEASSLARRVSYYLRQAEMAGRIILTVDGNRRQVFLIDKDKQAPHGNSTNMTRSTT